METEKKNDHKYNLRSKGDVDEVTLTNSPKKLSRKSKRQYKVDTTLAKRTVDVKSLLNKEITDKKSESKEDEVNITLNKDNSRGLATFALINSLVNAANERITRKNKKDKKKDRDTIINFSLDDSSDSESDPDYEDIEDLPSDVEYTEEEDKYIRGLPKDKKEHLVSLEQQLYFSNKNDVPLRFRILQSDLPLKSISFIIRRLDHFYSLDTSDNEYSKLLPWVDTLDKIPFGKYNVPKITKQNNATKIMEYLAESRSILDNAVYGHDSAKTQIISTIAHSISNPKQAGNAIAIQGPMGNGKTTLIKDGVCKALNRPFSLIALGGLSDASYFHGHEYTYEGARAGRIVEILTETGCMDPVIYFDELDKLSDTPKGEEIMNILCHLTDSSQNKLYQDKYFSGLELDLSRALFIFSYNDESKINPILLDRMYKIKTDGFNNKSKMKIAKDYLLPKLLKEYNFSKGDITFNDEALTSIINSYCDDEKGVRNLKRGMETVIAKLNIMRYLIPDKVELQEPNSPIVVKEPQTEQENNKEKETKSEDDWETESESSLHDDEDLINSDDKLVTIKQTPDDSILDTVKLTIEESLKMTIEEKKTDVKISDVVNFTIKNFKIPYTLTTDDITFFLKQEPINPSILALYS